MSTAEAETARAARAAIDVRWSPRWGSATAAARQHLRGFSSVERRQSFRAAS